MLSYRDIHKPVTFPGGRETMIFGTIKRRMSVLKRMNLEFEPINLDPIYQRGHVWTKEQQEAFVGHMLEGGATPIVIINRDDTYSMPDEVVDGKQRITAIWRWICGEIAAKLESGERVYLDDFSEKDQKHIMGISGPQFTVGYVFLNRQEVMKLYLKLNRGGTVHTEEEIERVQKLIKD